MLRFIIAKAVTIAFMNAAVCAQQIDCIRPEIRFRQPDTTQVMFTKVYRSEAYDLPPGKRQRKQKLKDSRVVNKSDTVYVFQSRLIRRSIKELKDNIRSNERKLEREKYKPTIIRLHSEIQSCKNEISVLIARLSDSVITSPFNARVSMQQGSSGRIQLVLSPYDSIEFAPLPNMLHQVRLADSIACYVMADGKHVAVDKNIFGSRPRFARALVGDADTLAVKFVNLYRATQKYYVLKKPAGTRQFIDSYTAPDIRSSAPSTRFAIFDSASNTIRHLYYEFVHEDEHFVYINNEIDPNFCFMLR